MLHMPGVVPEGPVAPDASLPADTLVFRGHQLLVDAGSTLTQSPRSWLAGIRPLRTLDFSAPDGRPWAGIELESVTASRRPGTNSPTSSPCSTPCPPPPPRAPGNF